jgi:hypothetical protein
MAAIDDIRKELYAAMPPDRVGGVLTLDDEYRLFAVLEAAKDLLESDARLARWDARWEALDLAVAAVGENV